MSKTLVPWWQQAPQLAAALVNQRRAVQRTDCYQFGDGVLVLEADDPAFCQRFRQAYLECALALPAGTPTAIHVRCTLRSAEVPRVVWFAFDDREELDLLDFSLRVLPGRGYREIPSTVDQWRFLASPAMPQVPFMVVQGNQALIDGQQPWQAFVGSCAVNRVLKCQPDVLCFHAASIGLQEAGTLLTGPKGAGKSTTVLTLASRGHHFLGDEIAAVRCSGVLLPFRRSVSIRAGPRAQALEAALQAGDYTSERFPDGTTRIRAHVRQLFPEAVARPVPLRQVIFLRHFAPRPRLEPFDFTLHHTGLLQPLSCTLWGLPPGRQLMKFMTLFARLRCYFLDLGEPEATADLLESLREAP
ncbi:MAG: hypothetical protein AB7N91_11960 [Candidatus Tectimicrobiota bacterium]